MSRLLTPSRSNQHNTEEQKVYDAYRSAALANHGIRVVRFWNNEVMESTEEVVEAIAVALGVRA
jgi:very-short-patch-repair endonuclease